MACTGIQTLIDEQRRLYRLLDSALNGTTYTATVTNWGGPGGGGGGSWGSDATGTYIPVPGSSDEVYQITPALDPVPPTAAADIIAPGLRARVERLEKLLDNAFNGRLYPSGDVQNPASPALTDDVSLRERIRKVQGVINAGWFGIGGQDATLADVVNALRVGDSGTADDLGDWVHDILTGAGSAASIASSIAQFISSSASATTEGGILATLIGASVANAAMMGAQAAQLDRLIASLDGGGAVRPGDNVLQALRGDVEANDVRNVIDAATNVVVRDKLDRLVDEVSKINSSNADLADLLAKLEDIRELLV